MRPWGHEPLGGPGYISVMLSASSASCSVLAEEVTIPSQHVAQSLQNGHRIVTNDCHVGVLMSLQAHLFLHERKLDPGEEWNFIGDGWRFMSVVSGQGYWLGHQPKSLEAGGALLLSPLGVGTLRASQLTALSFIYFYFQPERLTDLLTPIERHYLESAETRANYALRLFPASDPCAQQFKALASRSGNPSALASRSAILQLISSAVGIETLFPVEEQTKSVGAKERFQQVIGRMTEADLVNCTLESLATQCRCSARHLNRLFQAFFKLSLSSRQKEVRMQKAARMLRETNLKIAEIAGDCGYRHMSLFNATFKARWKHTPTEWRHLQRQTTDCQPLG